MDETLPPQAAVLVIQAWTEPSTGDLRARITQTNDTGGFEAQPAQAAGAVQIMQVVQSWLDGLTL